MAKVKITVVKTQTWKDLFGNNPPAESAVELCHTVELGQEFIVEDATKLPSGFCPSAMSDIRSHIVHLLLGGDYPGMKEKGVALLSCTDGRRPVIFKLERIED